ncbi:MAG: phosphodiester glycosidase family protein [Planctomycetota bacterium]|nr:phosphodiester glycosidase family protein [Planctomycetota bacterium]
MAQEMPVESAATVETAWKLPDGVTYARKVRQDPRPLQIHSIEIDMRVAKVSFAVVPGEDPDGDGPAEVALASPNDLAQKVGAIAAINTAAWAMLLDPETGKPGKYKVGGAADISGWVSQGERMISPPQGGYWSVWMDGSNRISMGLIASREELQTKRIDAKWAVSGFRGILKDSKVLVEPQEVRHPRTAVGISADGMKFVWLVVDGRQKGYSEGVSEEELARLLLESGCTLGINLDGGGSSSMWIRNERSELVVANRPSDPTGVRPVPVILSMMDSSEERQKD